jgi:hypothetical protein
VPAARREARIINGMSLPEDAATLGDVDLAPGSTVLELQFDTLETATRQFLTKEREIVEVPYNLMRYGPRVTAQLGTPENEPWAEVEPLLRESPLLRVYQPGGGAHDGLWLWIIASAPAWAALASVLKAYITRRVGRKVVLYGDDGTKLLEVTGDLTAEQIEALLRARVAPPELGGTASDSDTSESRPTPPDGPNF